MFNSLLASGLTAQSFLICTAVSLVLGLLTAHRKHSPRSGKERH